MTLKDITNKILDEKIHIETDAGVKDITKREAFVMRLVQDATSDDDPVVRQKAAIMVLDLCGFKNEVPSNEPRKTGIKNKSGKQIGSKNG